MSLAPQAIWPQHTTQPSACGFQMDDTFDRADSDSPGTSSSGAAWVEAETDVDIASNLLLLQGTFNRPNAYVNLPGRQGGFVQVRARWNNDTVPAFMGLKDKRQTLSRNGYHLRIDDFNGFARLEKHTDFNTLTTLASTAGTWSVNTFYDMQLSVETDGTLEAWCTTDSGSVTVSATDTAHANKALVLRLHRGFANAAGRTVEYNNALWTACSPSAKDIVVTGMSSGFKAKVRNAALAVVAQATESGGTATVDCSRFGGATEIVPVPGGWFDLIITNASDVTQKTIPGPIHPGQQHVGA